MYNKNETKGYPTPCFMQLHKCSYNHQGISYIIRDYIYIYIYIYIQYSRAHKLFGHSRVFILTIMIYVKRIIFSNDCISKRLKDRKLKLVS